MEGAGALTARRAWAGQISQGRMTSERVRRDARGEGRGNSAFLFSNENDVEGNKNKLKKDIKSPCNTQQAMLYYICTQEVRHGNSTGP